MQAQTRQAFQLRAAPLDTLGQKALCCGQHRVGLRFGADAPQQALGLQACAAAGAAGRVAAVLGQQHPDVHLVGLGLQVHKKAVYAVPLLVPLAGPTRCAFDHPFLLRGRELVPGGVARNTGGLGVAHQIVLAFFPRGGLNRLDRTGAQRQFVVRNHQPVIHPHHPPETTAHLARTHRRVEGKHGRNRLLVAQVAGRAMQSRRKTPSR